MWMEASTQSEQELRLSGWRKQTHDHIMRKARPGSASLHTTLHSLSSSSMRCRGIYTLSCLACHMATCDCLLGLIGTRLAKIDCLFVSMNSLPCISSTKALALRTGLLASLHSYCRVRYGPRHLAIASPVLVPNSLLSHRHQNQHLLRRTRCRNKRPHHHRRGHLRSHTRCKLQNLH
jgi:hypothetical protein